MPEGDLLAHAAAQLDAALSGSEVVGLEGSHRSVRMEGRRIVGKTVTSAEAHGKHLLVHFDNGWTLRTHLGMTGQWHVYDTGERWRKSPGKARAVIRTRDRVAVCFAAPTVDLSPRGKADEALDRLGPDLLGEDFDEAEALRLATEHRAGSTAADLLLDQRVMAGVGNVYKSEVLFLEKIHPEADAESLTDGQILALAARSRRLLWANRVPGRPRNTTGDRGRGRELWVYDRRGKPCRRCGTPITSAELGRHGRVTYWCPGCQRP